MRDLVMLAFTLAVLPMAFMNAFVAFMLWVYTTLLSPNLYLYGFMADIRYVFIFAGIALGLLLMGRLAERGRFLIDGTTVIMIIFMTHAIISALTALQLDAVVWYRLEIFIKGMVLALAAPLFLTSRWRIHILLIVVVAGLGFHGVVDGLKVIASGGTHNIRGMPSSTLADNNLFALGMVMLLPLFLYVAKYSERKAAKIAALIGFGLCVMTVLGSNSRGGFLALAVVGFWYWITSSRKFLALVFLAVVGVGVVQFAPDRWFDRIESIKNAGEDESFLGRIAAWRVSVNIANDNPILGGGFNAVEQPQIWNDYKDTPNFIPIDVIPLLPKSAHSIYFQVLGDLGYPGFLLYMSLLCSGFYNRWRIQHLAAKSSINHDWAVDLSTALTLSVVAFMAGGAGVSMAYYELVFLFLIMLSILNRMLSDSLVNEAQSARQTHKGMLHA